ncbi:23S rRNA (adenine(1618)-N(6))-methyltransferase RlmF [Inquilinus sp. KBS0705]|nr:23S rRNA (adenine(1618)-N(6))-methyltransferase RlmF [Inquilinus sp. KBS0705]
MPADQKTTLHPLNAHRNRYNFAELIKAMPQLAGFVALNEHKDLSINFADANAVKVLNQALLKQFYGIDHWDIPEGFLCPPIPGRADYIHYAADILAESNDGAVPTGRQVKVLDIGVGANCIYPLIGYKTYGWSFVGSEIDHIALRSAKNITEANGLAKAIEIRKQTGTANIFEGIIKPGELFDIAICNPPFHASEKEALEGSQRKWKNLGHNQDNGLNFGGRNAELWVEGGEVRFINKMMSESARFANECLWFTTLVSKKTTLPGCYKSLDYLGAKQVKTIDMVQGQKTSRILAWTFG